MEQVLCRDKNVVYVDFTTGRRKEAIEIAAEFGEHKTYLEICAATLSEKDYYDLLYAIQNPEFYRTCDEEIQELVDGYFAQQ